MKKIFSVLVAIASLCSVCFAACDITVDGYQYCDFDLTEYNGLSSAPSVSDTGSGRIYFDISAGKFKCSENGGAYANCVSAGGGTWGSITGTLSSQTDLQSALDAKASIAPRVVAASNATSITPNTDSADITTQANTQGAGTLTINADGGSPTNGQKWILRISSTSVQTFSWNAQYVGSDDLALPTVTSSSGKYDYFGFIYNSTSSKWQLLAVVKGF
jgi:hypothetical protein